MAIKELKSENRYGDLSVHCNEINIIRTLPSSPNIIKFFGVITAGERVNYLVLELGTCNLDDLFYSKHQCTLRMQTAHVNNVCKQLLEIYSYMEQIKLYYGDFKLENLLYFFSTDKIKLIDFGVAKTEKVPGYKAMALT
ncbi:protein kinase [Parashewanella spongiae]|nr:protein kinase [Parashewanella spongiae]